MPARSFNGTTDRLDTGLHLVKGATAEFSVYAWISHTEENTGSIIGVHHQFVPNNRFEFKAGLTNAGQVPRLQIQIECSGIPSFRTIDTQVGPVGDVDGFPFWSGKPFFVACVNDVPNNRTRFFWGLTADGVIEVPVGDFTTVTTATAVTEQWTDAAVTLNIGATGREGQSNPIFPLAEDWFDGVIDTVGLEFDTVLTLAQLKERAHCGLNAASYFWPIDGTDPEPGITAIYGTTVVGGICDPSFGDPPVDPTPPVEVSEIIRQTEYLELADLLPQTCSLIPRIRILRLDDLIQVMELTGYEFLRYTKVWQGIGEFELLINGQSSKADEMRDKGILGNIGSPSSINNFIINVTYDGVSDFSGIFDYPSVEWADDGTEMVRIVGPDLTRWLADRYVIPPTGQEHDSYGPDLQETIIKSLVYRHLINPIATDALGFNDSQRAIDYLLSATDLLRGSATTFEGRGQSLFSAVQEVANFANEFGFSFYIQNDTVIFDIFDGEDVSDSVHFDIELGNVSNFKIEWDGMNFVSHALLAGQGEGTARIVRNTQTSPATFTGPRRRELFQDARDLDTEAKLIDRGTAIIRDRSRMLRMSAKKIMSRGPCYKDDFNLGDLVTVRNRKYNVSQSVKIYEVQVIHQAQQAPQVLLTWNAPTAPSALKLVRDDIAPGTSRT